MENMQPGGSARDAAAALVDAELARASLARGLVLPSGFHASIGAAVAVQIATLVPALVRGGGWLWWAAAGIAAFLVVAGGQVIRFRRLNGVWLGGLASRVVGGTATAASIAYAVGLVGATWSGYAGLWWLVVPCAVAGGAGYAASGVNWVREYRRDPARNGRGEPAMWLAAAAVLAIAGLVAVIVGR